MHVLLKQLLREVSQLLLYFIDLANQAHTSSIILMPCCIHSNYAHLDSHKWKQDKDGEIYNVKKIERTRFLPKRGTDEKCIQTKR